MNLILSKTTPATRRSISYGEDTSNRRPYFLEFCLAQDGEVVERIQETFETKQQFMERIEGIVPIFEG